MGNLQERYVRSLISKVDADEFTTRNPIQFDLKFSGDGELAF
jgi:hypothetical protein